MPCPVPRKLRIVVTHHEKVIAGTLCKILHARNVDATAAYSGVSALETVFSKNPDLAILCIVPAHPGDLNGVFAAVAVRALMPACRILLCPGGSGLWVDEPLALAKARGYEFELLPEPIHPETVFELLGKLTGGDIEPIRSMPAP